eukprot:1604749-Amphidinium_carterae.3
MESAHCDGGGHMTTHPSACGSVEHLAVMSVLCGCPLVMRLVGSMNAIGWRIFEQTACHTSWTRY